MFSVREKVTFTFGFFYKADLVSSLKECASTLAKVVVGKNSRVVGKIWLQRSIQVNLPCI